MEEKKKLILNCDVCDTRKMNAENYSNYENIVLNTDIMIVNERSKGIINNLPIVINSDKTIMVDDDVEVCIKSINGSYEISGNSCVEEHTILAVNGSLFVHSGTEEILKKYEAIVVNGSARYPKGLEGFMNKISVNGSVDVYPDGCVLLDSEFTIDKYFPLRAKEGSRYYVEDMIMIKDLSVDIARLVEKNVYFYTEKLILPECKIEDCVPLFDESVEFIVVPDGMKLICDDVVIDENFIRNEGGNLFIYGDAEIDADADMEKLREGIEKLIIKGNVKLAAEQETEFRRLNVEFDSIEIAKKIMKISNQAVARLDAQMFDYAADGIKVKNTASLILAENITPEIILEKLKIKNCAKVKCNKEQESAVWSVSENVMKVSTEEENEENNGEENSGGGIGDIVKEALGKIKNLADTKLINADSYIM